MILVSYQSCSHPFTNDRFANHLLFARCTIDVTFLEEDPVFAQRKTRSALGTTPIKGTAKLKQLGGDLYVDEPESPISNYISPSKSRKSLFEFGFIDHRTITQKSQQSLRSLRSLH